MRSRNRRALRRRLLLASDGELVRACRAGEEGAWATLVDRFSSYVYAIAVRVYRLGEHDAEDVFQNVFARTFEHLDRLRDDDAIRPWIGQLSILAIQNGDYGVVEAITVITAAAVILLNLLVDLSYLVLDPQVKDALASGKRT